MACAHAAELAVVIDDVGYHPERMERLLKLPGPVTLAVLPYAPHAKDIARRAVAHGQEVILHQPMEPQPSPWVKHEPGTLLASMTDQEFLAQFESAIDAVPNLKGVSNHTGSLLTAHPHAMRLVMQVVKRRGLYFLDSRTTAQTVALDTARAAAIPAARRDVFLDHIIERPAIHAAFQKAVRLARKRGRAIIIAHPYELSIDYLERALANLPADVSLVTAGYLAHSTYPGTPAPRQIAASPRRLPGQ